MAKKERTLDNDAKYYDLSMKMQMLGKNDCFRKLETKHSKAKKGDIILEFGCGTGMLTEYLIKEVGENGKIVGVDIGESMLNIARKKLGHHKNISFIKIDKNEKLPMKSNSADVVVTSLVMHLLTPDQKTAAFKEMYRVLKKNGSFLCVDFGKPSNLFGRWIEFYITKLCIRIWPYEANSIENFQGKLPDYTVKAGFKNVKSVRKDIGFVEYITATK